MKHYEEIIRVKFKEHFMDEYTLYNIYYFKDFQSVTNWMRVQFRDLEVSTIEIDIIEVYSCEEYYG